MRKADMIKLKAKAGPKKKITRICKSHPLASGSWRLKTNKQTKKQQPLLQQFKWFELLESGTTEDKIFTFNGDFFCISHENLPTRGHCTRVRSGIWGVDVLWESVNAFLHGSLFASSMRVNKIGNCVFCSSAEPENSVSVCAWFILRAGEDRAPWGHGRCWSALVKPQVLGDCKDRRFCFRDVWKTKVSFESSGLNYFLEREFLLGFSQVDCHFTKTHILGTGKGTGWNWFRLKGEIFFTFSTVVVFVRPVLFLDFLHYTQFAPISLLFTDNVHWKGEGSTHDLASNFQSNHTTDGAYTEIACDI